MANQYASSYDAARACRAAETAGTLRAFRVSGKWKTLCAGCNHRLQPGMAAVSCERGRVVGRCCFIPGQS